MPAGQPSFVARSLGTNTGLRELDLSDNVVAAPVGAAIAEALLTNSTLVKLGLSRTRMEDTTGALITKSLGTNTGLCELDLNDNLLGFRFAEAFILSLDVKLERQSRHLSGGNSAPRGARCSALASWP